MKTTTSKQIAHKNYLLAQIFTKFRFASELFVTNHICGVKLTTKNDKYIIKYNCTLTHSKNERRWSTMKTTNSFGKFRDLEFTDGEIHEFLPILNEPVYVIIGNTMWDTNPISIKFRAFIFDLLVKNSNFGFISFKHNYLPNNSIFPLITEIELNPDCHSKDEPNLQAVLMKA